MGSVARSLLRVIALAVPTIVLATFLVFLLIQITPGDAAVAIAGDNATPKLIAALRQELGLNAPLLVQYWHWLSHAVQFNFGKSFFLQENVTTAIAQTIEPTLQIVLGGLIFSAVVGVAAGVASARRARRVTGQLISSVSSVGVAMPSFWLGLILVSVFALHLHLFPATGFVAFSSNPLQSVRTTVLPAVALGLVGAAEVARQLRSVMISALDSDYVRTLRASGTSPRSIIWRHAMKNSAIPLVTILGLQVNRFLGATVVLEAVFGIPGMGTLMVTAAQQKDLPVVQGVVMVMVLIVIGVNLVTEVIYRLVDPRIR
jgi:peptide/nickel transport system permease protein